MSRRPTYPSTRTPAIKPLAPVMSNVEHHEPWLHAMVTRLCLRSRARPSIVRLLLNYNAGHPNENSDAIFQCNAEPGTCGDGKK